MPDNTLLSIRREVMGGYSTRGTRVPLLFTLVAPDADGDIEIEVGSTDHMMYLDHATARALGVALIEVAALSTPPKETL